MLSYVLIPTARLPAMPRLGRPNARHALIPTASVPMMFVHAHDIGSFNARYAWIRTALLPTMP
jgi:hypothetical protein